jgi:hypothetical protein
MDQRETEMDAFPGKDEERWRKGWGKGEDEQVERGDVVLPSFRV